MTRTHLAEPRRPDGRSGPLRRPAVVWALLLVLVLVSCATAAAANAEAADEDAVGQGIERPALAAPTGIAVGIPQVLLLLVFAVAVFYVADWTYMDVRFVGTNQALWSGVVLAGGLAGLAAAALVPLFLIGMPLGLLLFAGAAVTYAMHRNTLVTPALTVLSAAHVDRVKRRLSGKPSGGEAEAAADQAPPDIIFVGADDMPIRLEPESPPERKGFAEAARLLHDAVIRQATLWGLMITPQRGQIRLRVEGEVVDAGTIDRPVAEIVGAFIKRLAGLDPKEVRKPQEGRVRAAVAGHTYELRVKSAGSVRGEQIGARILDLATSQIRVEELGLDETQREALAEALDAQPGLIILSGPRNSGLTTTLQACVRRYDRYVNNVLVFEPHVDTEIEGVQHVALSQEDGAAAAALVRPRLEAGPDIVAIDALNAPEVASLVVGSAAQHRAVAALRAGDAGEAVGRLASLLGAAGPLAQTLRLVVNQRLVRLLCPQCKEAYRPNPDFIRKANLGSKRVDVLYRPPTHVAAVDGKPLECPECHNARYVSRAALFEVMSIDDEARRIIDSGGSVSDLRVFARKRGMRNLQEAGLQLVIEGRTSIDEVIRAIKQTR